ncbi:hypothetical protein [Lysinibacillus sphaericus]|uniref:hypothetical protein n=1 Tax=Lysinibacillus sphaericus TaxID=1421 RepID=UPI0005635C16|nr:hypothetical protein [Lysinibacillus sphaericus]
MDGVKEVDGRLLVTTARLCDLLEISDKTTTNWRRSGCPQHSRGWWDIKDVMKWRGQISTSEGAATKKGRNLQQEKLEWEVEYKKQQTELTRMKNDLAEGKYVERDFAEAELSRFFLVFKKSVTSLSRKLGNVISSYVEPVEARRVEQEIADTINDALEQMSVDGVYNARKAKKKQ